MDLRLDSAAAVLRNPQTSHRRSAWRRGEAQPVPEAGSTLLSLAAGKTWAIEDAGAFVVHCARGTLWVTSPTLGCDLILASGERLQVSTRGKLLVAAMTDSAMWLPSGHALEDGGSTPTKQRIVRRPQWA